MYYYSNIGIILQELVVRLTDEKDLFFLYTLKLTEEDFQRWVVLLEYIDRTSVCPVSCAGKGQKRGQLLYQFSPLSHIMLNWQSLRNLH